MLTIEFYETESDIPSERWRWRAVAANGKIIADSSEGYTDEDGARRGFNTLKLGIEYERGYKTKSTRRV